MAADETIIDASAIYIRIETISNIFSILQSFALVGLVSLGREIFVYILTCVKLVLYLVVDIFFVSTLDCSFNLGVNGIGISNIIVNAILFAVTMFLLYKNGINIFNKKKMNFKWIKEFAKV